MEWGGLSWPDGTLDFLLEATQDQSGHSRGKLCARRTSHLTVNIMQSQSWRHNCVIYHTSISSQANISQVIALQPYISVVLYVKGI